MKVQKVMRATGEVLETKEMNITPQELAGEPFVCVYGSVRPRKTEGFELLEKEIASGLKAYIRFDVHANLEEGQKEPVHGSFVANMDNIKLLNVDPDKTWEKAIQNIKQDGYSCKTMIDYLNERMGTDIKDPFGLGGIYVVRLNRNNGYYGAGILALPCMLDEIREEIGDYMILPSSVHEIICIPKAMGMDAEYLRDMVGFVNATEIAPEDKLSDDVFLFDSEGLHRA